MFFWVTTEGATQIAFFKWIDISVECQTRKNTLYYI